jgi:hypothetical protein
MRNLYPAEERTILDWFLYRMTQEQRRELMGDLPRHYAMLYPSVDPAVLCAAVERQINKYEQQTDIRSGQERRTGG